MTKEMTDQELKKQIGAAMDRHMPPISRGMTFSETAKRLHEIDLKEHWLEKVFDDLVEKGVFEKCGGGPGTDRPQEYRLAIKVID